MDQPATIKPNYAESDAFTVVVKVCQLAVWPGIWVAMTIFRRSRRREIAPDQVEPGYRYVIYANHGRRIDPFFIMLNLPFSLYLRLTPCRFFIYNQLFDSILRPFIVALGCFPARQHRRYRYGLDAAQFYLNKRQTVFIFPEGQRAFGVPLPPRPGIAKLADTPQTKLIPVRIEWSRRWSVPCYRLVIGRPFDGHGRTAEELMDIVYAL